MKDTNGVPISAKDFDVDNKEHFSLVYNHPTILSVASLRRWLIENGGPSYSETFLGKKRLSHSIPKIPRHAQSSNVVSRNGEEVPLSGKIRDYLKRCSGEQSIEDVCNFFDVSPKKVKEAIKQLEAEAVLVNINEESISLDRDLAPHPTPLVIDFRKYKETITPVGFVTDTHLGSKYERLDVLNSLYDRFVEYGVETVYHGGNIIEGEARFNKFEIYVYGVENQVANVIEKYPQRKGITTKFVTGDDHEGWYTQRECIDVGRKIEQEALLAGRSDLVHLGYMERDIELRQSGGSAVIRIIHAGGGCFDERAEILTRHRGWVKFSDLALTDEVATMTKNGHKFEWQNPTHITNESFDGELIDFKHRCYDFSVTKDHGLWVRSYRARCSREVSANKVLQYPQKAHFAYRADWHRLAAEEIETNCHRVFEIPTVCQEWEGELIPTIKIPRMEPKVPANKRNQTQMQHIGIQKIEDIAELMAWYVTEGNSHPKGIGISQHKQVNPENHKKICDLFSRMGLRYGESDHGVGIGSKELSAFLTSECGHRSGDKHLPLWLKNQPKHILRIVFETMIAGDGWKTKRSFWYRSISEQLRTDFGEIAQKLGYGSSYSGDGVSARVVQNNPHVNKKPTRRKYSGRIFCATVPNELIYVRSAGHAFWSHNSAYATSYTSQKYAESLQGGEKPNVVLVGHFHKFEYGYPREIHMIQGGTTQGQTRFMRKKKIQAHVGGVVLWITQNELGILTSVRVEWIPFYDKKFYQNNW